jgi:chromosomal replication initiation ATPase DnaA
MDSNALAENLKRVPTSMLEQEIMRRRSPSAAVKRILEAVAEVFGLGIGTVLAHGPAPFPAAQARQLAMKLTQDEVGNLSETARIFRRKCHATISLAVKRTENLRATSPHFAALAAQVEAALTETPNR